MRLELRLKMVSRPGSHMWVLADKVEAAFAHNGADAAEMFALWSVLFV